MFLSEWNNLEAKILKTLGTQKETKLFSVIFSDPLACYRVNLWSLIKLFVFKMLQLRNYCFGLNLQPLLINQVREQGLMPLLNRKLEISGLCLYLARFKTAENIRTKLWYVSMKEFGEQICCLRIFDKQFPNGIRGASSDTPSNIK